MINSICHRERVKDITELLVSYVSEIRWQLLGDNNHVTLKNCGFGNNYF